MKKLVVLLGIILLSFNFINMSNGLAKAEEYKLGPGDVLNVNVWGFEELSSNAQVTATSQVTTSNQVITSNQAANMTNGILVRPDGCVSFPLVGQVMAAGLTITEFTNLLSQSLKEYINEPKVTVNIAKFRTTRVYVLGEVLRPGMYELDKQHKLLDAIGIAGGYTPYAAKKLVYLLREGQSSQPLKVNLLKLLKEGDMSQNLALGEGDVVYLTSSGKLDFARDILPFLTGAYYVGHTDK
ncbi:MAG: polysaccharide export protein [Negativicutes bacterium]|nr:polysaccharide export protein [Negativicutes bacterium]